MQHEDLVAEVQRVLEEYVEHGKHNERVKTECVINDLVALKKTMEELVR